jgi:hypothetical protein
MSLAMLLGNHPKYPLKHQYMYLLMILFTTLQGRQQKCTWSDKGPSWEREC